MNESAVNKKVSPKKKGRPPVKSRSIEQDLRRRFDQGDWNKGDLLPSEAELTVHYGVSRMTLRQAMSPLEKEGLLLRVRGKGTFAGENRTARKVVAIFLNRSQIEEELSYHDQLGRGVRMIMEKENLPLRHYSLERGKTLGSLLEKHPREAASWGGVLALPGFLDAPSVTKLNDLNIPCVCFSTPEMENISFAGIDDRAAGVMAMEQLLRSGRTRPLIIDVPEALSFARRRREGILSVLTRAGIKRDDRFFLEGQSIHSRESHELTAKMIRPFLEEDSIDSIIVYMEHPTIGVYRALASFGLTPGREIGVIHINDYPWLCQILNPQPSAVRLPFDVVAREAATLLQKQMVKKEPQREIRLVKPHLIIRET